MVNTMVDVFIERVWFIFIPILLQLRDSPLDIQGNRKFYDKITEKFVTLFCNVHAVIGTAPRFQIQ